MARMMPRDKSDSTTPNKYNMHKEWEGENANPEKFVSADDSLAYVKPKKYAMLDPNPKQEEEVEEVEAQGETQEEEPEYAQPAEKYQRVNWKKRYDDLKRHHDKRLQGFKEEMEELKRKMRENEPAYTPPKSSEDLDKFKQENPDLYEVVESVAHIRSNSEIERLKAELKEVQEKLTYEAATRAYAELKSMVPDFDEIRQSEEFHMWASSQPEEIQNWVYKNSTNAELAAKAINLYKADTGLGKRAKQQKPPVQRTQSAGAEQAVPTARRVDQPSSSEKIWKTSEIAKLHWKEFEKRQAEIDRAYAEGRVIPG